VTVIKELLCDMWWPQWFSPSWYLASNAVQPSRTGFRPSNVEPDTVFHEYFLTPRSYGNVSRNSSTNFIAMLRFERLTIGDGATMPLEWFSCIPYRAPEAQFEQNQHLKCIITSACIYDSNKIPTDTSIILRSSFPIVLFLWLPDLTGSGKSKTAAANTCSTHMSADTLITFQRLYQSFWGPAIQSDYSSIAVYIYSPMEKPGIRESGMAAFILEIAISQLIHKIASK